MNSTMQRTLVFLIVLAAGAAVLAARADNSTAIKPNPNTVEIKIFWSDAVEGIQAGVLTEPNQDPSLDRTYQLDLAFHESGLDTSLGLQHVTRAIHFTVTSVSAQITDHKGAPADTEPLADVPTPPGWDLVIPPDGEIHFPIGHGGSSPHQAPGITPKGEAVSPRLGQRVGAAAGPRAVQDRGDAERHAESFAGHQGGRSRGRAR